MSLLGGYSHWSSTDSLNPPTISILYIELSPFEVFFEWVDIEFFLRLYFYVMTWEKKLSTLTVMHFGLYTTWNTWIFNCSQQFYSNKNLSRCLSYFYKWLFQSLIRITLSVAYSLKRASLDLISWKLYVGWNIGKNKIIGGKTVNS